MRKAAIVFLISLFIQGVYSQENARKEPQVTKQDAPEPQVKEKKFGLKISGYVKNDFFVDTRQTVAAREGHFLLWPKPVLEDDFGHDLHSGTNFNILAIQSRLSLSITGPQALGAKTSGLIEGDFFAQSNNNINLFRLRHAFVKLTWTHLELLAGQYWNPLFITECFPGTVSFNTGTPLQSFARNPQIRVSFKAAGFKVTAAALSQRDYATVGMSGISSEYLRNSGIPDMHLQLQYGFSNDAGNGLIVGTGMAYKQVVPRLSSTTSDGVTFKVDEKVGSFTVIAYAKLTTKPITAKLHARYGENISDVLAISGYAITEISDTITGRYDYTPLKGTSLWGEIHTNTNPQVGLFGGVTWNHGTKDPISIPSFGVYGWATDIRTLYRISPRVVYNTGKVRLALELEYTLAAYASGGTTFNAYYIPVSTTQAGNLRALLAIYYFF